MYVALSSCVCDYSSFLEGAVGEGKGIPAEAVVSCSEIGCQIERRVWILNDLEYKQFFGQSWSQKSPRCPSFRVPRENGKGSEQVFAFSVGKEVLPFRQLLLLQRSTTMKNTTRMSPEEQAFEAQGQLAYEAAHSQWSSANSMDAMYGSSQLLEIFDYLRRVEKSGTSPAALTPGFPPHLAASSMELGGTATPVVAPFSSPAKRGSEDLTTEDEAALQPETPGSAASTTKKPRCAAGSCAESVWDGSLVDEDELFRADEIEIKNLQGSSPEILQAIVSKLRISLVLKGVGLGRQCNGAEAYHTNGKLNEWDSNLLTKHIAAVE